MATRAGARGNKGRGVAALGALAALLVAMPSRAQTDDAADTDASAQKKPSALAAAPPSAEPAGDAEVLELDLTAPTEATGLEAAEQAWGEGRLEDALALYEAVLKKGGLEPKDVLVAYTRIGTVRAALGDETGALSAFRVAAVVDPTFELSGDSGPAAQRIYEQAREQALTQGARLSLDVKASKEPLAAGQPFALTVGIPDGFSVFVETVTVRVRDVLSGKVWVEKAVADGEVVLRFPGEAAVAGASLRVEARAVDADGNAWVLTELRVAVDGARAQDLGGWGIEEKPVAKEESHGVFAFVGDHWPWFAGGAAAVAAGAAMFFVLRPTEVSVGAPAWQQR